MEYVVCTCRIVGLGNQINELTSEIGKLCFGNISVNNASFSNYLIVPDFNEVSYFHCVICIPNEFFYDHLKIGYDYPFDIITNSIVSFKVQVEAIIIRKVSTCSTKIVFEGHFSGNKIVTGDDVKYCVLFDKESNPWIVRAIVNDNIVNFDLLLSSFEFSSMFIDDTDNKYIIICSGKRSELEIDSYSIIQTEKYMNASSAFGIVN